MINTSHQLNESVKALNIKLVDLRIVFL